MPVSTIKAGKDLIIKFRVPKSRIIEYVVEAERPVSTWVLDEEGLRQFSNKRVENVDSYYGGFHRRLNHQQELKLPFTGSWYLAIENLDDKNATAVHYEVSG